MCKQLTKNTVYEHILILSLSLMYLFHCYLQGNLKFNKKNLKCSHNSFLNARILWKNNYKWSVTLGHGLW